MTHHQRGYGEPDTDRGGLTISANRMRGLETSNEVLRRELQRQPSQFRGFSRGFGIAGILFGALGFWAGRATADEVSISGTIVALQPSLEPGAAAEMTVANFELNGSVDNGTYHLSMPEATGGGLTVQVIFTWDQGDAGEDRIEVIPPAGFYCEPMDCAVVVPEGQAGRVVIFPWMGA